MSAQKRIITYFFSIPPITESKVIGCLKSIDLHKACGIDKPSPPMLKLAAPIIAPSIAKLINHSFNTASFPRRWKTAKVSPLFKGGDSEDLNNYRRISVLSVLSKAIERHVHDSLSRYLCENNLIYSKQSGFRKLHSTETALIRNIDELLFNLDNNRVSGMILIDYCKAFDMVDHVILLDKLHVCPTGLLFVLSINELPLHVSSANTDLYADDTTLTCSVNWMDMDRL